MVLFFITLTISINLKVGGVMKTDFSLYIGCALTHATEEFKQNVQALKERLKEVCTVLEFVGLVDGSAQDVYNHDVNNCVRGCNLLWAFVTRPPSVWGMS